MAVLYDHLTSLVVAGTVVMLLAGVQLRGQRIASERTMMYASKAQILSLADVLEKDLVNVGFSGVPGDPVIDVYQTKTVNGIDVLDTFVFYGKGRDGARSKIKYEVDKVGTKLLGTGFPVPLFEWQRSEWRGGRWVEAGRSPETLADFDLNLLDVSGTVVRNFAKARQLRIRIVNGVAPGAQDGFLARRRRLYWGITLRPVGMKSLGA